MTFLRPALLLAALALAACGADGAPERPEPRNNVSIDVSGTVGIGVSGSF